MKKEYLKVFINGNRKDITVLYYLNRQSFFHFGAKYGLDYDELSDIYQDAFIALRKHALKGKMVEVQGTLKSYLFGIGKYMILDKIKQKQKKVSYDHTIHDKNDGIEPIFFEIENKVLNERQELLKTHYKNLGKKCQNVLTLFYYHGLTIDEIVEHTEYNNSSVVRSHKSRCLKKLKEMIKAKKS